MFLTPKQVHDDQIKQKREYDESMGRENQGEDQGEGIPSDSTKTETTTTDSESQTRPFDHNSKTPKSGRELRQEKRREESQEK